MIELLSPVGNFECLKAAVQNGANSVYFGANSFSARAFASNFTVEKLKDAIIYAKFRGVKTNLALNTLIKDSEFEKAFYIAQKAYEYGIDAIIVQDLGVATTLIKAFPDLDIHASTQMTVHNLEGVHQLEKLGFKRAVLSRELSLNEIEHICKHSKIEIECFIHGALCISYSGQCLFSSIVGGRSGNRGECAQPCRLPYQLLEKTDKTSKLIDKGYLLSTRDLCGLDYIPQLISAGVKCFKIEGRMKNPEYVAIVTRIYRKYIDLAKSSKPYIIDENDKKLLLQVFNRGSFSEGHLSTKPNHNLVYKEKSNNMGIYLGTVKKRDSLKYITLKLNEKIEIGDSISLENEEGSYTVSELMSNKKNITETNIGQTVTIGRIKGNIKPGDKVYKLSSKSVTMDALNSFKNENIKIPLDCKISIKKDSNISISISYNNNYKFNNYKVINDLYKDLNVQCSIDTRPIDATNHPLTKEKIISQINKTNSTIFEFKNIKVDLDKNLFLPKISTLNELRRNALNEVLENINKKIIRTTGNNSVFNEITKKSKENGLISNNSNKSKQYNIKTPEVSVLLNIINPEYDYAFLENIDNIYVPLKYFINKEFKNIITILNNKFKTYIVFPTVVKSNYKNLLKANIENALKIYKITGFVISNISNFELLNSIFEEKTRFNKNNFEFVGNYSLNVFNNYSLKQFKKLGLNKYTISPELDKKSVIQLLDESNIKNELIVYGKTPLMNLNYCLLGSTNKCYPDCKSRCKTIPEKRYYLKDRLNLQFDILPDNIQTVTTIFNSKTTSIPISAFPSINSARIDILFENVDYINNVVSVVKSNKKFEGSDFTRGMNR